MDCPETVLGDCSGETVLETLRELRGHRLRSRRCRRWCCGSRQPLSPAPSWFSSLVWGRGPKAHTGRRVLNLTAPNDCVIQDIRKGARTISRTISADQRRTSIETLSWLALM